MDKCAICVVHHRHHGPWLDDLLASIQTDYPVIISNHEGWVMDAVRLAFENTPFDEIFFLNESMVVKDNAIWDIVFKQYPGKSVAVGEKFLMHLGKYRREVVSRLKWPVIKDKRDEVLVGEFGWTRQYIALEPDFVHIEPITDTDVFEQKHGRRNMILENSYFKKYKHCWSLEMIDELY